MPDSDTNIVGDVTDAEEKRDAQLRAKNAADLSVLGAGDSDDKSYLKNAQSLMEKQIGAEGAMADLAAKRDEDYRVRQEHALAAEGASAADLKPWNAEQELESRKTDLWSQFGSPGFVISMLASAFTAQPMNSALNAGASAMNAINQGDMKAYDKAFEAWKSNTDLTIKRMDMEQKAFDGISHLRESNLGEWRTQAEMLLQRFNDQRKLTLLREGYDKDLLDAQDAETKSKLSLAQARMPLLISNLTMQLANSDPDYKSGDPKRMITAIKRAEFLANSGYMDPETGLPNDSTGKDLPYAASFGLQSSFNWVSRKAQDLFSGSFSQPTAAATQATQDLEQLRFRTLNALSSDIESPGRLKMIQERVQELFPKIESLWTGPAEATVRIKELRSDLINEMKQNQQIMADPSFPEKERTKAHLRLLSQTRVVMEMNKILQGINKRDEGQAEQSGPWDKYKQ